MWLRLDGEGPRFRQIHRALRGAILEGRLAPGAAVPPSRTLAADLGVSRTTVVEAYEQLLAEGYLVARRGAGTFVALARPARSTPAARRPPARAAPSRSDAGGAPALSPFGERLGGRFRPLQSAYSSARPHLRFDFRYGLPSLSDFPLRAWHRCLGRRLRRASVRAYDYGPPEGARALREAIAEHLGRARGVACDADQVVIVNGSQQGLDLAARLLLRPGDAALVEDPGFEGARRAFEAAGARLLPAPVDDDGVDVDADPARGRRARLAHVTPSHQYPLGSVLSLARRLALLAWADRHDATVIEDDYDGEYRLDGRPLEPLQALDGAGRVIHLGTFSKVMFPALRIGYLVLPEPLVEPFVRAKNLADGGSATLEQEALADFIAGGDFERHIRRSRARSRERRQALVAALRESLGDAVEVSGANAGLHLVAWLRDLAPRELGGLVRRAAAAGVGVYPVTPYYVAAPPRAGLVLGYAALPIEDLRAGVQRLAAVLA